MKESHYGQFGNYIGEYNRETMNREGVGLQLEGESLYIGHFLRNKRHGKGRVISKTYFFQGYFSGDLAQGQGLYRTPLMKYQGNFSGGVLEGSDITEDNIVLDQHYLGQFVGGQRHGKGIYGWEKEGCVYQGEFKHNMVSGKGVATWKNKEGTTTYSGGFINNRMHFQGHYQIVDQDGEPQVEFSGQYYNGQRHGHGVYNDSKEGQRVEAYFQNGKVY